MDATKPWTRLGWALRAVAIGSFAVVMGVTGCVGDDTTGQPSADAGPNADASDAAVDTTVACPSGQTSCNGACVDTSNSLTSCGTCGTACAAGQVCSKGTCAADCGSGTSKCNDRCYDLASDPSNCGACGTTCGAGEVCSQGKCALTCGGGTTKCGAACIDPKLDPRTAAAAATSAIRGSRAPAARARSCARRGSRAAPATRG